MAKKEFDIGGQTRLKPMSIRTLFTFSNIVMFVTGFQLVFALGTIDWQKSLLAIVFSMVIAIEIGLKRYTNLSSLKKFGLLQWLGTIVVIMLFDFGLLILFNLINITSLNQIVGTVFMISSVTTTIDMWV